jgi:hypothetical protein
VLSDGYTPDNQRFEEHLSLANFELYSTMLGSVTITVSVAVVYSGEAVNFELMLITLGSIETLMPMLGATPVRQAATLKAKRMRKAGLKEDAFM